MRNIFMFIIFINLCLGIGLLGAQSNQGRRLFPQSRQTRPPLQDENRDHQLFRTAQAYLNMNRFDNAIVILEDLHRRNPDNISYYRTLLQAYLTMARIEQADSLVQQMSKRHPGDARFKIDRAGISYQQDNKDLAFEIWQNILNENPKDIQVYNQVANAMLQNRLYDKAIEVYEAAIENIPNADFLYRNIANLYRNRLMYKEAARYYLTYLEKNPNQDKFVYSRILSFNLEPEQRADFFSMMQQTAEKSKHKQQITLLMAQLYQRYREFNKAYRLYGQLEHEDKDAGYMLQFARAAQNDSSYQIALKAYHDVILESNKDTAVLQAYSGAVTTLFRLAENSGDAKYANRALGLIDTVRQKYPQHPHLGQLRYLQGVLYLDYFFDVDRAMNIFSEITNQPKFPAQFRNEAFLKLGDCYLIKGQLQDALNIFKKAGNSGTALLKIAYTHYFMKNWDETNAAINQIIKREGIKGDVTNDALQLKLRVDLAETAPAVLEKIAEADLLIFQRKKSEAVKTFTEVMRMGRVPPMMKSDIYQQLETLSLELEEPDRALEFASQAIQDSSLIRYFDHHLFMIASILDKRLNQPEKAFEAYRQLLESYPFSLDAEQARARMKFLKEQYPQEIP